MCSAIAVAIGAEGVGTVLKGAAAKQQGEVAKDRDYLSADSAERAAADATENGKLKQLQVVLRGSNVVEAQRIIQSGTGADVNIGSTKATQDATDSMSEIDRRVVERNAAMEAYGLRSRARALRQQGSDAEAAGDAAMTGTFLSGIGQIGAQVAGLAADQAKKPSTNRKDYVGGILPGEQVTDYDPAEGKY